MYRTHSSSRRFKHGVLKKTVRHSESSFFRRPTTHRARPVQRLHPLQWMQLFFGFALIAWLALMLYLPYFRITKVSVNGLQLVKQADVVQSIQDTFLNSHGWWPKNNYFLVPSSRIQTYLLDHYPLRMVEVKKSFPSGLDIHVEEKSTSIVYDDGRAYYLIDQNGTVSRKLQEVSSTEFVFQKSTSFPYTFEPALFTTSTAPSTTMLTHMPNYSSIRRTYGLFPLVYKLSTSTQATSVSSTTFRKETIDGITSLYSLVEQDKIAIPNYVVLGNEDGGAALVSNQPWRIYFMPSADIPSQLQNVKIILRTNKPSDYIDVRFGDRVYWK